MSTSSTSAAASDPTRVPQYSHVTDRRNPVVPIVTRGRSTSAPPVMKSTPTARKAISCTDKELAELLADLSAENEEKVRHTPLPSTTTAPSARNAIDDELDHEIESLFAAQLAEAISQNDEERMLASLETLMEMFRHAGLATRRGTLPQVIPLLQLTSGNSRALRMAVRMIDEFVAANENSEKERTNAEAEWFISAIRDAVSAYPLGTRCKILVYELWGAKKLGSYTMAKTSIDLWTTELCADNHDETTRRIEQAVDYIATMPLKYRLMAATGLYRCVPDDTEFKLRALEAIAQNNLQLPDTIEARDFSKIVNQQIFTLRLDAE